jgi:uncharacterized membrane protein YjgN (DUF898 family)
MQPLLFWGTNETKRLGCYVVGSDLFHLFIVNVLLGMLTLGGYRFWGKTRIRQYLWSRISFDDEGFEYTGLGKELFRGFLGALGIFACLIVTSQGLEYGLSLIAPGFERTVGFVFSLALYLLAGIGAYSGRRYLLSHTCWRSIRFGLSGSAGTYAKKLLFSQLLSLFTLGLYTPFRRNQLTSYQLNNTWFGSEQFVYDGQGRDLFSRFLLAYLLLIPTLGLIWFWYKAEEYRYMAAHTQLQGARFAVTISARQLMRLTLGNWLLLLCTLGLAYPLTLLRKARALCLHLVVDGPVAYEVIVQSERPVVAVGEGLAGVFGLNDF